MRKAPELVTPGLFVRCCVYRLGYAEQIPVWLETSFDQLGKLLDKWTVIHVLPRLVQILVIGGPILHRDDDGRKSCPHKLQVHDEPGGPTVSVPKGMDDDQVSMHPGSPFNGMKALGLAMVPIKEALHAFADMEVIRRGMPRTRDDDVAAAITSGFVVETSLLSEPDPDIEGSGHGHGRACGPIGSLHCGHAR